MSERNVVWLHTCYLLKHHRATVACFGKKYACVSQECTAWTHNWGIDQVEKIPKQYANSSPSRMYAKLIRYVCGVCMCKSIELILFSINICILPLDNLHWNELKWKNIFTYLQLKIFCVYFFFYFFSLYFALHF